MYKTSIINNIEGFKEPVSPQIPVMNRRQSLTAKNMAVEETKLKEDPAADHKLSQTNKSDSRIQS